MSLTTQNTIKLFMALQEVKGSSYAQDLPVLLDEKLNELIQHTNAIILIRKELGV